MISGSQISACLHSRAVRRAAAFALGIGMPAVAALWLHQSAGLLLSVIAALMFSFADDEGPLARRFIALGRAAAGMAVGGGIGHWLGGYGPAFWVLFAVAAFAAAWLHRFGRTAHIGMRLCAMSMAITAGSPEIASSEVLFVVGALAGVALVRLADHAMFGPLPKSTLPAPRGAPEGRGMWLRYAAAYAAAATIGLWIGVRFDPQHAIWVAISTLVVMQPDDRHNYRRILERIVGTAIGVFAAYALTQILVSVPMMVAVLVVTAAVLPDHVPLRYWLHSAAIALLVLLAYDLAYRASGLAPDLSPALFRERLIDVLIGCVLALIGTEVGFPWGAMRRSKAKPAA